jgi:hypothetical protein
MLNTLPTCPTPTATTNTQTALDDLTPLLHEYASRKQNLFVILSVLSPSLDFFLYLSPTKYLVARLYILSVLFSFYTVRVAVSYFVVSYCTIYLSGRYGPWLVGVVLLSPLTEQGMKDFLQPSEF